MPRQVGVAVTQMDQMTQQNAALVEQSASAAEHMAAQAEQLVSAVARFKVEAPVPQASGRLAEVVAFRRPALAAPNLG